MINVVKIGPAGCEKVAMLATDAAGIVATLELLFEQGFEDVSCNIATTIEVDLARMTREQFDNLPEFGGW